MSFRMHISPRSRRAARFIASVHSGLQQAYSLSAKKGLTQQQMATALEVDRSTINKRLQGLSNLTLRSISDMAWAMGHSVRIDFEPNGEVQGNFWRSPVNAESVNPPCLISPSGSISSTTPVRANISDNKVVVSDEYA